MKKILNVTFVALILTITFIAFYGTGVLIQSQKQNQKLEFKLDALTRQIEEIGMRANKEVAGDFISQRPSPMPSLFVSKKTPELKSPTPEINNPTPTPPPSPSKKVAIKPVINPPSAAFTPQSPPEPTPTPTPTPQKSAKVDIENQGNYTVDITQNDTAFSILQRAARENNFSLDYQDFGIMGIMVNCIAAICSHDNFYWAFYYNNQYGQVGASNQIVSDGDITGWKYETW